MTSAWMVLGIFLVASVGAQASLSEGLWMPRCAQLLGDPDACALQYDGERHGDASAACEPASPTLTFGRSTDGFAFPIDDPADNYRLEVPIAGRTVTVTLQPAPGVPVPGGMLVPDYNLVVFAPKSNCTAVVGQGFALGRDVVRFIAPVPGRYTVQVLPGPFEVVVGPPPLPGGLPLPIHGEDEGYGTDVCHAFCFGDGINPTLGYGVTAS